MAITDLKTANLTSILNIKDPLKSTNPLDVAIALSDVQLNAMSDSGYGSLAEKLKEIRDKIWERDSQKSNRPHTQERVAAENAEKRAAVNKIISSLTEDEKPVFLESYARMGNLYEIACMTARSNYLEAVRNNSDKTKNTPPGGIEELVIKFFEKTDNGDKKISDLVAAVNRPVFEMIFTAHPTNLNSLESMAALRNVAQALESGGDKNKIAKAVAQYQATPITNLDKNGNVKNLTVRDEIENMLYSLGNIYEDLPNIYKLYDGALAKKADERNDNYNPTDLQLQTRLGAWGSSGDKDGNKSVNAETTLEAIALHTRAALTHYSKDLEAIKDNRLHDWKRELALKEQAMGALLPEIEKLREDAKNSMDGKGGVSATDLSKRFDDLSEQLKAVRDGLDANKFAESLKVSYEATKDQKTLDLLRRVRTFAFNFGKIEYRETAVEYARAMGAIISCYDKLSPAEKEQKLTAILTETGKTPAQIFAEHKDKIIAGGAGKKYSDDDAMPIAYASIKRMQLARDFPEMIKDNVLAECGQLPDGVKPDADGKNVASQGVANLLEAQFLQRAVDDGKGNRAKLWVVPLFEEADTMKHIDDIMRKAYHNEAYRNQLETVKEHSGESELTQQVMVAHSDNARRSGVQAARGFIHDAHKKLRALGSELEAEGLKINTQFYEGGSISDAYRNGVRAISANVNAFGIHDFAKFTFQGGDLPNYFNHPESTRRIIDRSIAHQAGCLAGISDIEGKTNNVIDDVAILAMTRTYDDYLNQDFDDEKKKDASGGWVKENLQKLLALLDYNSWVQVSNMSSRAAARKAGGDGGEAPKKLEFAKVAKQGVGAIDSAGVDMRTIGFSMTQQVGGMLPTWVGATNLEKYLNDAVSAKYDQISRKPEANRSEEELEFLDKLKTDDSGKLRPDQIRFIYEKSPAFRDGQDKAAAGMVISDLDTTKKIITNHMKNFYLKNVKWDAADNKEEMATNAANRIIENYSYWEHIQKTYNKAVELTHAALTGKPFNASNLDNAAIVKKMKDDGFAHMADGGFDNKFGYRDVLFDWRLNDKNLFDKDELAKEDGKQFGLSRLFAAAIQPFTHGRWLDWSDPTLAKHRKDSELQAVAARG